MAIITADNQIITLSERTPQRVRMQGKGADGEALGVGIEYAGPEDAATFGPYKTGCRVPNSLCYDVTMQKFKADRVIRAFMRRPEEIVTPPVTLAQVYAGDNAHYALLTNGGLLMAGAGLGYGEDACLEWNDTLAHFACGYGFNAGLGAGGYHVAGSYFGWTPDFTDWPASLAAMRGSGNGVYGVTTGGKVHTATYVSIDPDVIRAWTGVVDVAASTGHVLALRDDGTVVAAGADRYGQVSGVAGWSNIVSLAASTYQSIGVKADGSVVRAGYFYSFEQGIDAWTDIVQVASIYGNYKVGLTSAGIVRAVGSLGSGCAGTPLTEWEGVRQISGSQYNVLGRTPCRCLAFGQDTAAVTGAEALFDYCDAA